MVVRTVSVIANRFVDRRGHPAEEWVAVAALLSATGGFVDAFAWLHHGVLATVQSANMLLFGVYAMEEHWGAALKTIPPMCACIVGTFAAHYIRLRYPGKHRRLSLILEIFLLLLVLLLHLRQPEVAGIVVIAFASAVQNTCFIRVEGWAFSSVMMTRNLQMMSEGIIGILSGAQSKAARQVEVFATLCLAFTAGAVAGAFFTPMLGALALAIPVVLVSLALVVCELGGRYLAPAV